ncbi:DsbA family protein [Lichenicoccus sp.]|uniref:DsbA family protein n=1 Tax=Lichenicoccus sp. TaxID=2781899 RepID=UPI003D0DFFE0
MFASYFTEGQDLSNAGVLRRIALTTNIDAATVDAVLSDGLGAAEVRAAQQHASMTVAGGIPQLEIGKMTVSGAQPRYVIERALLQAAGDRAPQRLSRHAISRRVAGRHGS